MDARPRTDGRSTGLGDPAADAAGAYPPDPSTSSSAPGRDAGPRGAVGVPEDGASRGRARDRRARPSGRGRSWCVSSTTVDYLEDVAGASEAPKWWQLYVFTDRGLSEEMLRRVARRRYRRVCFTVDFPVGGLRHRDTRTGSCMPIGLPERRLVFDPMITWDDLALDPRARPVAAPREGHPHRRGRRASRSSTAPTASSSPTTAAGSSTGSPPGSRRCPRSSRRWPAGCRCSWTAASGGGPTSSRRSRSAPRRCWWVARPRWGLAVGGEQGVVDVLRDPAGRARERDGASRVLERSGRPRDGRRLRAR